MTKLRIHFELEDLADIRIAPTVGPMLEAFFALQHVGKSGSTEFRLWQQKIESTVAFESDLLTSECQGLRSAADIVRLLSKERGQDHRPAQVNGTDCQGTAAELRDFQRRAIAPYWPQMRAYLSQEREQRVRMLASGGFHQLFKTLHPRVEWNLPTLEVPAADEDSEGRADVTLHGSGLVIAPSIFQLRPIDVLSTGTTKARRPVLIYSAPPGAAASSQIWTHQFPTVSGAALAPLVGRTRAAVLLALDTPRTTSELAKRVHISAPAASQHAAILRDAGLVASRRVRNKVFHGTTPLGTALMRGRLPRTCS